MSSDGWSARRVYIQPTFRNHLLIKQLRSSFDPFTTCHLFNFTYLIIMASLFDNLSNLQYKMTIGDKRYTVRYSEESAQLCRDANDESQARTMAEALAKIDELRQSLDNDRRKFVSEVRISSLQASARSLRENLPLSGLTPEKDATLRKLLNDRDDATFGAARSLAHISAADLTRFRDGMSAPETFIPTTNNPNPSTSATENTRVSGPEVPPRFERQ